MVKDPFPPHLYCKDIVAAKRSSRNTRICLQHAILKYIVRKKTSWIWFPGSFHWTGSLHLTHLPHKLRQSEHGVSRHNLNMTLSAREGSMTVTKQQWWQMIWSWAKEVGFEAKKLHPWVGWLLEQWKNGPSGCLGHIGDYTILPSYMFYFFTWQVKARWFYRS